MILFIKYLYRNLSKSVTDVRSITTLIKKNVEVICNYIICIFNNRKVKSLFERYFNNAIIVIITNLEHINFPELVNKKVIGVAYNFAFNVLFSM